MSQCRGMMIPISERHRRPLALPPLQPAPPALCPAAACSSVFVSLFYVIDWKTTGIVDSTGSRARHSRNELGVAWLPVRPCSDAS